MKYNCLYKFWYDLKLSDRMWCKISLHMIRCITPHERQNIFFVSSCDLARVYQHFVLYWFKSSITKTISRMNGKHFLHNLTNLLLSFKENTWQCNVLIIFFFQLQRNSRFTMRRSPLGGFSFRWGSVFLCAASLLLAPQELSLKTSKKPVMLLYTGQIHRNLMFVTVDITYQIILYSLTELYKSSYFNMLTVT